MCMTELHSFQTFHVLGTFMWFLTLGKISLRTLTSPATTHSATCSACSLIIPGHYFRFDNVNRSVNKNILWSPVFSCEEASSSSTGSTHSTAGLRRLDWPGCPATSAPWLVLLLVGMLWNGPLWLVRWLSREFGTVLPRSKPANSDAHMAGYMGG